MVQFGWCGPDPFWGGDGFLGGVRGRAGTPAAVLAAADDEAGDGGPARRTAIEDRVPDEFSATEGEGRASDEPSGSAPAPAPARSRYPGRSAGRSARRPGSGRSGPVQRREGEVP